MSEKNKNTKFKVLRVTQLDAEQLDYQIYELLKTFLIDSLKNRPFTFLLNFEPELAAGLRLILWNFSVKKYGKDVGQTMLGTEFISKNGSAISKTQRYSFAFYSVIIKWVKDRQNVLLRLIEIILKSRNNTSQLFVYIQKLFSHIEVLGQLLSFINFLQFLKTGDHVNLIQRFLEIRHVYSYQPSPRYIDYAYRRKEMIWESITETILCLLPFINFRRIVNIYNRLTLRYSKLKCTNASQEEDEVDFRCRICNEQATNPYSGDCGHVYCYYCISGNIAIEGSFRCYVCGMNIMDTKPTQFHKSAEITSTP